MDASIIAKVSEIILENRLGVKLPDRQKASPSKGDRVQISSVASEANQIAQALDNADRKRNQAIAELKSKIDSGSYRISEEIAEQIAARIAQIFV